ncbi:MAG: glucosamine-6-phosphate deaminase [Chitinophagaceae bacterium]|jgi:glucosamine-6-phosphate isomerase|nr:glucosamine-6-phosphate deaminase [Chitinophagaceae bacterium]
MSLPHLKIYNDYNTMSAAAAELILDVVRLKPEAVLCFATGNTPVGTYRELAAKARESGTDFSRCFCIGLDEWLGVPGNKSGSCKYILQEQVFDPLGIKPTQVHLFDGLTNAVEAECEKMNALIDSRGGIDCMLVGIGTNGHIGFNEPGVDSRLKAHEQVLHASTLDSGKHYFNEPTPIKKGITLGLAQVLQAKMVLLLANGVSKSAIIRKTLEGEISPAVPASFIQQHTNAYVLLDKEAAAELTL